MKEQIILKKANYRNNMFIKIFNEFKKDFFLNKNEKKFIKNLNKIRKYNSYNNKNIFITIATDYFHLCQTSFLIKSSKYKDYNIIGIWNYNISPNWKNKNFMLELLVTIKNKIKTYFLKKKWTKLYTAIGVNQIIDTNNFSLMEYFKSENESKNILNKIQSVKKEKFLKLKLNNIVIGDLIIDTYIRFRNIQTIEFKDFFLKKIIKKFIISQKLIHRSIEKFKPEIFISNFSNYSNGVVVRTALKENIKVFCTGDTMSYLKKLSKKDSSTHTSYKNFKNLFKNLRSKDKKLKKSRIELKKRFSGVKDEAFFYMKKNPYRKSSKKLKFKTDGVLFLHDFFDTPHHFKSMIFMDFYDWAIYSLNIIRKNKLNIAVKPHPNSIYQNKVVIEKLKKMFPEIRWIDPSLTNSYLFKSGIKFGISVYGTVLYELAYHNLVPIASTPYHPTYNYDVVYTPKNKNDYSNLLINSNKLKLKKNLKKKIEEFYYMWTFYNHDAIIKTGREIKLKNIDFSKSNSLDEYFKRLTQYMKISAR